MTGGAARNGPFKHALVGLTSELDQWLDVRRQKCRVERNHIHQCGGRDVHDKVDKHGQVFWSGR
jgi:hypothetical protein